MKTITGLFLAVCLLFAAPSAWSDNYRSAADGAWSNIDTWEVNNQGWKPAKAVPTAGDIVNVRHAVTIDMDAACSILVVNGSLSVGSPAVYTLTVGGPTIGGSGILGGATDGLSLVIAGKTLLAVKFTDLYNVTIADSCLLMLGGDAGIHGALLVQNSGLTSDSLAHTLTLKGTVTNNGLIGGPESRLFVAFTNDITLAGYGTAVIGGFSVAPAKALTLGQPITVLDSLVLDGPIFIGNHDLTLVGPRAFSSPLTAQAGPKVMGTSPIVTNGTGMVIQGLHAGQYFTFPIAPSVGAFNPVTLALGPEDSLDVFRVRVEEGINPTGADPTQAVNRTWTVHETTIGGNNATMTLQWSSSDEGPSFTRSTSSVWYNAGSAWTEQSVASVGGSDPFTGQTVIPISAFGTFTVANPGALPVQISSFKPLVSSSQSVTLAWETVSELNNYGFEVWRSAGRTAGFYKVSELIPGHGTTLERQSYSWTDVTPKIGEPYYRLRQIDADGKMRDMEVIRVDFSVTSAKTPEAAPTTFQLSQNYPNPFNPATTIGYTVTGTGDQGSGASQVKLTVYNALGQEVAVVVNEKQVPGRYSVRFDASKLASGMYLYRLQAGNYVEAKRMLLLK